MREVGLSDIIVPAGLLFVVGCVLVPLPTWALDLLLTTNLLFALMLVVGALQIRDPLKVASLPSLLLMTTLFRLALNIATTRAVLGSGHAGEAVEAFGSVVTQGSCVVGLVLFALITLVQFVVVAKGAERVAEVAARFTLDALPGKQMAIDAELRSGMLDPETARARRADLQRESRFYGALDGAMKFVKGDAIAGIVITLVNITGGLAIGMIAQKLSLDVAARKYTVLTIGDGLLSQIPSLLNAVAAGLVVTRVQVDERSSLSNDLLTQLGAFPIARKLVAGTAVLLGLLPGMPHVALLALALVLTIWAVKGPRGDESSTALAPGVKPFEPSLPELTEVRVGRNLLPRLSDATTVTQSLEALRERVFARWGIVLTRPGLGILEHNSDAYRISVRGIDVLERIPPGDADLMTVLSNELEHTVHQCKVELIDDAGTRRALDYVERQAPDLVSSVVPQILSLTQMTSILRQLLVEGIPIRHLDVILQTIAEHGNRVGIRALIAEVRVALKQVISRGALYEGKIRTITLDPLIDLLLVRAEESGTLVNMELVDRITEVVKAYEGKEAVVVTSKRARPYLRDLLGAKGVSMVVVAHEEIIPGYPIEVLGAIEPKHDSEREALLEELTAA